MSKHCITIEDKQRYAIDVSWFLLSSGRVAHRVLNRDLPKDVAELLMARYKKEYLSYTVKIIPDTPELKDKYETYNGKVVR